MVSAGFWVTFFGNILLEHKRDGAIDEDIGGWKRLNEKLNWRDTKEGFDYRSFCYLRLVFNS